MASDVVVSDNDDYFYYFKSSLVPLIEGPIAFITLTVVQYPSWRVYVEEHLRAPPSSEVI